MLKKLLFIWSFLCLISCFRDEKAAVKPIYDEFSLSKFVISSANQNQDISEELLDSIFAATSPDSLAFASTINFLSKFYSDPNSPFRNEMLYDKVLKAAMGSKWCSISDKQSLVHKFHLLHQNDVGSLGNDFEYWTPKGQKNTMHSVDANELLLFFYNPECNACKELKSALMKSSIVQRALTNGQLKILSIYTDTDLTVWHKHLLEFPSSWIQGRDKGQYIYKNDLYDLRAIPTIYLLDKHKKVVLKDCTSIIELEQRLH